MLAAESPSEVKCPTTISENEMPNKDIICVSIDNMLCDTAQLMRAKGRNVKCPNHRGICTGDSSKPCILFRFSNFCLRSCMSVSFTCTVVLLAYIPAFFMALHEGTGMPADKNNACTPSMRFLRPIPEPQVTEPELLRENMNDIVGNTILHCGKLTELVHSLVLILTLK
jgi:hypothetical protein